MQENGKNYRGSPTDIRDFDVKKFNKAAEASTTRELARIWGNEDTFGGTFK